MHRSEFGRGGTQTCSGYPPSAALSRGRSEESGTCRRRRNRYRGCLRKPGTRRQTPAEATASPSRVSGRAIPPTSSPSPSFAVSVPLPAFAFSAFATRFRQTGHGAVRRSLICFERLRMLSTKSSQLKRSLVFCTPARKTACFPSLKVVHDRRSQRSRIAGRNKPARNPVFDDLGQPANVARHNRDAEMVGQRHDPALSCVRIRKNHQIGRTEQGRDFFVRDIVIAPRQTPLYPETGGHLPIRPRIHVKLAGDRGREIDLVLHQRQ